MMISMDINVTSPKTVKELLEQYSIAPLKKYGQNFLIDGNITDKIAYAAVPEGAYAIEIGPGLGALTSRLIKRALYTVAYEIDAGLYGALCETMQGVNNLKIFHQDFMKADLVSDLLPLFGEADIYVAANLPYNITSASIMKLLSSPLNFRRITVMVQKEVADRICAQPGNRDYGAISAAVAYFALPEKLFTVSPSCFYPQPGVMSAVLKLEMISHDRGEANAYLKIVKSLFAMRRKTVKSNLRQAFGFDHTVAETILARANIPENARAEMLSVKDYINISKQIVK